jgi:hypothetical protein
VATAGAPSARVRVLVPRFGGLAFVEWRLDD